MTQLRNLDEAVARGFGDEWTRFDQTGLSDADRARIWYDYFEIFPWDALPPDARGIDLGCGSGRWALLAAPRVGHLLCVDASAEALAVARRNLHGLGNVAFAEGSVEALPVADGSQDFIYCLGVLHHVPDTARAVRSVAAKLKPGAPFLLYLYYDFENRPAWYRLTWKVSDVARRLISRAPYPVRYAASQVAAGLVYWPLARLAARAEKRGADVSSWPLAYYRDKSFYVARTDALDRFGTQLEQRFSRRRIREMLAAAGCGEPVFSNHMPFWVAVARKL